MHWTCNAFASLGEQVTIYDVVQTTGALTNKRTIDFPKEFYHLTWSPDEKYLAYYASDQAKGGHIFLLPINDLAALSKTPTTIRELSSLKFSPDSKWLLAYGKDKPKKSDQEHHENESRTEIIERFNVKQKMSALAPIKLEENVGSSYSGLAFSPTMNLFIIHDICGRGAMIYDFDTDTGDVTPITGDVMSTVKKQKAKNSQKEGLVAQKSVQHIQKPSIPKSSVGHLEFNQKYALDHTFGPYFSSDGKQVFFVGEGSWLSDCGYKLIVYNVNQETGVLTYTTDISWNPESSDAGPSDFLYKLIGFSQNVHYFSDRQYFAIHTAKGLYFMDFDGLWEKPLDSEYLRGFAARSYSNCDGTENIQTSFSPDGRWLLVYPKFASGRRNKKIDIYEIDNKKKQLSMKHSYDFLFAENAFRVGINFSPTASLFTLNILELNDRKDDCNDFSLYDFDNQTGQVRRISQDLLTTVRRQKELDQARTALPKDIGHGDVGTLLKEYVVGPQVIKASCEENSDTIARVVLAKEMQATKKQRESAKEDAVELFSAIKKGYNWLIDEYLNPFTVNEQDELFRTPLIVAITHNQLNIAKKIFAYKGTVTEDEYHRKERIPVKIDLIDHEQKTALVHLLESTNPDYKFALELARSMDPAARSLQRQDSKKKFPLARALSNTNENSLSEPDKKAYTELTDLLGFKRGQEAQKSNDKDAKVGQKRKR